MTIDMQHIDSIVMAEIKSLNCCRMRQRTEVVGEGLSTLVSSEKGTICACSVGKINHAAVFDSSDFFITVLKRVRTITICGAEFIRAGGQINSGTIDTLTDRRVNSTIKSFGFGFSRE